MTAFAVIAGLVIVAALLRLGYEVARKRLADDRERLEWERNALATEWQALDGTRRVRAVFLAARHAMRDEARRHEPSPPAP